MPKLKTWDCCVCGAKYYIKGTAWRMIWGCRKCKKHKWGKNNKELIKIEKVKIND